MSDQDVTIHKLSNHMTLVSEAMAEVSSSAFVFLLPTGAARDPQGLNGTATILAEEVFRGAGDMDNRRLNERLDAMGLHRQGGAGRLHFSLGGALLGDNLVEALETYADIILRPQLLDEMFIPCRELALQGLDSLDDDPRSKISLLCQESFLPNPYGRWPCGKRDELREITAKAARDHWLESLSPQETILAVAGKFNLPELIKKVELLFGNWQGSTLPALPKAECKGQLVHEHNDGAQVHCMIMYPSAHYTDPDYYSALAAVSVLSGGMGSRLFTEVREKRGLCYAVHASPSVVGPYGAVQCYFGSSPENAQEALDVTLGELRRLADGITEDELDRAKVGLRASLIMQGESTTARAMGCVSDYYHLRRVRSLEEIAEAINSLTVKQVVQFAKEHAVENLTVATIGPKKLDCAN